MSDKTTITSLNELFKEVYGDSLKELMKNPLPSSLFNVKATSYTYWNAPVIFGESEKEKHDKKFSKKFSELINE